MLAIFRKRFTLVKVIILVGILNVAASQSVNEPLFNRGCRATRGQFPHETFCQQYYNCWDGRATIEECPGKLLFNPVISACDYPEAVNCGTRLRNPDPAVTADGRCLKQFGVFPDITDCTAFYKCSHGRAYRQICPYYTAFDERYSVCVHAYEVDCGGRGGVYGTLAPPRFDIPDGGARIGSGSSGSGSSASGWDRQTSQESSGSSSGSTSIGSQATLPSGSGSGTGGHGTGSGGGRGTGGSGTGGHGTVSGGGRGTGGSGTGGSSGTRGSGGSIPGGTGIGGQSGNVGSGTSGGQTSGSGGQTSGSVSGGSGRGAASSGTSGRGTGGSSEAGRGTGGSVSGERGTGPSGTSGGITGTRGGTGTSSGTHAGITGIVDKDISATGQERQYERPLSSEATFRCPHPRGLYPNALDCSRFWLCREYKPSLLKCPTGQLFDLSSLSCTSPEKAQCSSISPRT